MLKSCIIQMRTLRCQKVARLVNFTKLMSSCLPQAQAFWVLRLHAGQGPGSLSGLGSCLNPFLGSECTKHLWPVMQGTSCQVCRCGPCGLRGVPLEELNNYQPSPAFLLFNATYLPHYLQRWAQTQAAIAHLPGHLPMLRGLGLGCLAATLFTQLTFGQ